MREVLSGHQVTQKPPRAIRGALSALSLVSIHKESELTGVNHEQSEAIKGTQWALVEHLEPVSYTHLTLPTIYSV